MNLAQGYLDAFLRQFRSSLFSPPPLSLSLSLNWKLEDFFSFFIQDSIYRYNAILTRASSSSSSS